MKKRKFWYIPCELNRASLADLEFTFVRLTNLASHSRAEIPVEVPSGTILICPQVAGSQHLKGYVLGEEVDRDGDVLQIEVMSKLADDGISETVNIARENALTLRDLEKKIKGMVWDYAKSMNRLEFEPSGG